MPEVGFFKKQGITTGDMKTVVFDPVHRNAAALKQLSSFNPSDPVRRGEGCLDILLKQSEKIVNSPGGILENTNSAVELQERTLAP